MKIQLDNRLDGGKRPTQPPSMFSGVPSCALRSHQQYLDQVRQSLPKHFQENKNKTKISAIKPKTFKRNCHCLPEKGNSYLSLTDGVGQNIIHFIHFREIKYIRGTGWQKWTELHKKLFLLQKNSLLSKWTQICEIILVKTTCDSSNKDILNGALEFLHFQFIFWQLPMLLTVTKGCSCHRSCLPSWWTAIYSSSIPVVKLNDGNLERILLQVSRTVVDASG